MDRVTAIVAAYEDPMLRKAFQSLLEQTYPPYEIVLCLDNPSMEYLLNCIKLMDEYRGEGRRLRINWTVKGDAKPSPAVCKNYAMNMALKGYGDWFFFLDSDNYLDKDWIVLMLKAAKEHGPRTIPFCRTRVVTHGGIEDPAFPEVFEKYVMLEKQLREPTYILWGQAFMSRNQMLKLGPFDEDLTLYETSYQTVKAMKSYELVPVPEVILYCSVHAKTISSRTPEDVSRHFLDLYKLKAMRLWYGDKRSHPSLQSC